MKDLKSQKAMLAKLLAAENLNVVYENVSTASFDTNKRTITLPLWKNISPELYDLLCGHEVGHALYTPNDAWSEIVDKIKAGELGSDFKNVVNVLEDVRIERKIKEKYPGIRRSFVRGYDELVDRGFFGLDGVDPDSLIFLDRLNVYYKSSMNFSLTFTEAEQEFMERIDEMESFEDVIKLSYELYEMSKEELEKMRAIQNDLEESESGESAESDGSGSPEGAPSGASDESEESDESGEGSPSDEEGDSSDEEGDSLSGDSEESDESGEGSPSEEKGEADDEEDQITDASSLYGEEVTSLTNDSLAESIKTLASKTSNNIFNFSVPKMSELNVENIIEVADTMFTVSDYDSNAIKEFEKKNLKTINFLIKEFEMKKRAQESRRVSISDTGTIDTNSLHSYRFNDDIFRKVSNVADGKNHAMVMAVDWSGSMNRNLHGTIEQTLILAYFCRKVGIPFEVYLFSSEKDVSKGFMFSAADSSENTVDYSLPFKMIKVLSGDYSSKKFRKMCNDLWMIGQAYANRENYSSYEILISLRENGYGLGSTPLDPAILSLSKIANDFKKKKRAEIMNVIILSDGSNTYEFCYINEEKRLRSSHWIASSWGNDVYVHDNETKKSYKTDRTGMTNVYLKMLKDRTNCNLLGFFVSEGGRHLSCATVQAEGWHEYSDIKRELRKNNCYTMTDTAYDELYIINGGKDLVSSSESLDDALSGKADPTKNQLKTAFIKTNKARVDTKIILKKFVEKVA